METRWRCSRALMAMTGIAFITHSHKQPLHHKGFLHAACVMPQIQGGAKAPVEVPKVALGLPPPVQEQQHCSLRTLSLS